MSTLTGRRTAIANEPRPRLPAPVYIASLMGIAALECWVRKRMVA